MPTLVIKVNMTGFHILASTHSYVRTTFLTEIDYWSNMYTLIIFTSRTSGFGFCSSFEWMNGAIQWPWLFLEIPNGV